MVVYKTLFERIATVDVLVCNGIRGILKACVNVWCECWKGMFATYLRHGPSWRPQSDTTSKKRLVADPLAIVTRLPVVRMPLSRWLALLLPRTGAADRRPRTVRQYPSQDWPQRHRIGI